MSSMEEVVSSIIQGIKKKHINFVAIDFDLTLVSVHAGKAEWEGTVQELQEKVRPFFRHFIPLALENDLHIAIVTFSKRVREIEATIQGVFGDKIADRIVIRGTDNKWMYVGNGCKFGKQPHMASAASVLKNMNPNKENSHITRRSSLLIDDYAENVDTALKNGVCAIRFIPDDEASTIESMLHLFPSP